jgi:hypothetical protein
VDREAAGPKLRPIEPEPESEPERIEPEPGAQSCWVKPLSCYERKETTIVEGLRYGYLSRDLGDSAREPVKIPLPLDIVRGQGRQANHDPMTAPQRVQRFFDLPTAA